MTNKSMVCILGCGPSGLLAAHACAMNNIPFVVLSKKVKSKLGGAQFSHIPIPGIHDEFGEDAKLTYIVRGDAETYQRKVYGAERVPFVSFGNVSDGQVVGAWSLQKMYDLLWDAYSDLVVDHAVPAGRVDSLNETFDIVFNSAPAIAMCMGQEDPTVEHTFKSQPVLILNEALDDSLPDNTILYDGTTEHSYYRMSRIFNVGSTEWGGQSATPPIKDLRTINKPIWTNCTCHPRAIRIGRFGTWKKGELTMHAFNRVIDTLAEYGVEVKIPHG